MDYPHDRRHTHHHSPDRRDEDHVYPPPGGPHAPPRYGVDEPPPPQVYHSSHTGPGLGAYHPPPPPPQVYNSSNFGQGPDGYHPPPPPQVYNSSNFGQGPDGYHHPPPPQVHHSPNFGPGPDAYHPPPPQQAYHSSHMGPGPDAYHAPPPPNVPSYAPPPHAAAGNPYQKPNTPHFPPVVDHRKEAEWANKPSVRMYSKAETNYSLTIRDGKVILARSDPSDPLQKWVKDLKYSTRVKDEEGFPSFALVNKGTGQAMKHSIGATHPVQLVPYNPDVVDESILWTESRDLGDGYRTIRMVNNIRLNVDALNGDKNHGGIRDGTTIVLWEWKKGDNQRWKIAPH